MLLTLAVLTIAVLGAWACAPVTALAAYTSLVPTSDMAAVSTDIQTVSSWVIVVALTLAAVGLLIRAFTRG
jgi:hypothetical protein